jgi:hypothetical protein
MSIQDAIHGLYEPLGQPGSGRRRYASAMALNRAGLLDDAVLEVYRVCSPRDGEDAAYLLSARGLASQMPPRPDQGPAAAILGLIDAADRYLAGFNGPGIAEIRSGLASANGPVTLPKPARNAVVDDWLGPAIGPLSTTHPELAAAIAAAAPHLDWVTYDAYDPAQIGEDFRSGHAFASLIGGGAPVGAEDFDFGLFLIRPHVLYRDHCHPAPELYAPLTGPHGWRFGPGTPVMIRPAHQPVWNDPMSPHLTKVGPVPFLSLFGWTRDVAEPAVVLPAEDWAELEAWRINA